jgi:hypothetical protein
MAANIDPIYGRAPDVQVGGSVLGPTAVTLQDGTGATPIIFIADATEGGFVDQVRLKPVGSPAATVCRIFYCTSTVVSGSFTPGTTNTAANTAMIAEVTLAAVTTSNTAAQTDISIPIRAPIPASTKLLIGFGTSTGAAGTGYAVTTFGMKY